jgi:hypothetical protein
MARIRLTKAAAPRIQELADKLGLNIEGLTPKQAYDDVVAEIEMLKRDAAEDAMNCVFEEFTGHFGAKRDMAEILDEIRQGGGW